MNRLAHDDAPCRVMIVDDYPDAAESLAMLLTMHGHEVKILQSAGDVLKQARAFRPRVIILDIGLGTGKNGLQLASELRATSDLKDVGLVAWSGHGRSQDIAAGMAAGFDHYLVKPVDLDVLLPIVEQECSS